MRQALARTLLLMRDHLDPHVTDDELVEALTGVTVSIRCSADCARTHAGQTALITLCALLARSGHRIYFDAPDGPLIGSQPPARMRSLHGVIAEVAAELPNHPGTTLGLPTSADLEILLGSTAPSGTAHQSIALGWGRWAASLGPGGLGFSEHEWPIG